MPDFQQKTIDNKILLFDAKYFNNPQTDIFSAQHWQNKNGLTGQSTGRGTTYFFNHQQQEMVLRHYRRGGLIGKILHDHYLYTGLKQTRAWLEFNLLAQMQQSGLPTPVPIAAMVEKNGLSYRADLITLKIPNSQDAFQFLQKQAMPPSTWAKIGQVVRQLHDQHIFHHDLNIHNVMLDQQNNIWIIDFDKCHNRSDENWKTQNLERLLRSLRKEQQRENQFYWQEADWYYLLEGYDS